MSQHTAFVAGEADAWFARNRHVLSPDELAGHDPVLKLIEPLRLTPASAVLEVGASNGYRLAALRRRSGAAVTAVEPSEQAIADGRQRFPEVGFIRGLAHELTELPDAAFELVIVHFVLHWVDRAMLMRTVAELDRVLKDGGHLVVGDFYPERQQRVPYHHLPQADVWTYKQDYPRLWLGTGIYQAAGSLVYDHGTKVIRADVDPAHRAKVALLHKTLREQYQPVTLPR